MNKIFALLGVLLILVTGAAAVGLIGGGSSSTGTSAAPSGPALASANIPIASFLFKPANVHVSVGATVTWTNMDSAPHTATADQGPTFDTGTLKQHQSKTLTFATKGTFPYHCLFHAFMQGTVTVG